MRPRLLAILGALGASIFAAPPTFAQSSDADSVATRLAYVAAIYPERTYYCRGTPRGGGTSETLMTFDFELAGEGPVDARMVVEGRVQGRKVSARMRWRGVAGPSEKNPKDAVIVLSEVYDYDADPLPAGAEWSDPTGDVITLKVEPYFSIGSQDYILTGTQESEFGINDLRCLDGDRIR